MRSFTQTLFGILASVAAAAAVITSATAQEPIAINSRFAEVNGIKLHYLIAGKGDPVYLLHGYAQTSHMWRPLITELARTHTVIAPDLRGFGESAKPEGGYDKKTMAQDVHALAASLGHRRIGVVGHDIGLMVAYAYAAQYPAEVDRIALMDAFLPGWATGRASGCSGISGISTSTARRRWRSSMAASASTSSISGTTSRPTRPVRFRGGSSVLRDGVRAAGRACGPASRCSAPSNWTPRTSPGFAKTKLKMPMLVLTGEKASGEFLITQGRLVADKVEGVVIKGSGHWLIDEAPDQVIPILLAFFQR